MIPKSTTGTTRRASLGFGVEREADAEGGSVVARVGDFDITVVPAQDAFDDSES